MSGPKAKPSDAAFENVHARMLRAFPDLVAGLGGDAPALLREAKIIPTRIKGAEQLVTYRQLAQVLEAAAHHLDCPDFGMRLAVAQGGGGMFGPLGQVMKHSRTFGDAMAYVVSHSAAHSLSARIWLKPFPEERAYFVGHDILVDGLPNRSQMMEQILLLGKLAAEDITGGWARVRRVHFRHQPVSDIGVYRRRFGCEVKFGQEEDGVYYSERDFARQVSDPDDDVFLQAAAFVDANFAGQHPPVHAQVRGLVMQNLNNGMCTNESVAAELALTVRTLHRRLRAEGTSFQAIKDDVRRDVMLYCLAQTDLDLMTISAKLGFSEQAVMTRRCRQWFGLSPSALRRQSNGR